LSENCYQHNNPDQKTFTEMSCYQSNTWNYFGNSLADNALDSNVIQMWSKKDHNVSRFYTTGFETILFNKDHSFVLKSVLSSTISWGKELLITGNSSSIEKLSKSAEEQNLTFLCFDWNSGNWDDLEKSLSNRQDISHLLVGIDSNTSIDQIPVSKLLMILAKHKLSLIVYCDVQVTGLNDYFGGAIDYMIGGINSEPPLSFVVARRSRLVQTEGNSDSFNLDLYSFWQWSVRNRASGIEPMRY
jgi:hypothetical protein